MHRLQCSNAPPAGLAVPERGGRAGARASSMVNGPRRALTWLHSYVTRKDAHLLRSDGPARGDPRGAHMQSAASWAASARSLARPVTSITEPK